MKLVAIEPILRNGERIEPGATFAVAAKDQAAADALIAAGAAVEAGAKPADPTAEVPSEQPAGA